MAKLLLSPFNLLVLDEPTNHLDMDSKDILKNALLQYDGTLIVVSHDRDFLQGLTDSLFEFRDGHVHEFKGDVFEFLEHKKIAHLNDLDTVEQRDDAPAAKPTVSQSKMNYQQSKERERVLRRLRGNVERVEQEIAAVEQQIADKDAILASASTSIADNAGFFAEYQSLKDRLEQLMTAWEDATVELEKYSAQP